MARRSAGNDAIHVEGLPELKRALDGLGPGLKGELRKTNKTVADIVATDARSAARSLGSTAAHVAPSVKASAGALFAGVALGGPGYDPAMGAEFGSDKFKQFQQWRGGGEGAGYFLYPTIRRDAERIGIEYEKSMDDLLRKAQLV
jgi:hypothetical protein